MQNVFVNSVPLRIKKSKERPSTVNKIPKSPGVVIWIDGDFGEVLVEKCFHEHAKNYHFIFNNETQIDVYGRNTLQVGSKVEIELSFKTGDCSETAYMNHEFVYIEKMEVFDRVKVDRKKVLVIPHKESLLGMQEALADDGTRIGIHINCTPKVMKMTKLAVKNSAVSENIDDPTSYILKRFARSSAMFQTMLTDVCLKWYKMYDVMVMYQPFTVSEMEPVKVVVLRVFDGEKIKGRKGYAMITSLNRSLSGDVIEGQAKFLRTHETIYFIANSCSRLVLSNIKVGRVVVVKADRAFPMSAYHWYAHRVKTVENIKKVMKKYPNYKKETQVRKKEEAFNDWWGKLERNAKSNSLEDSNSDDAEKDASVLGEGNRSVMKTKKKVDKAIMPTNSVGKRFKSLYHSIGPSWNIRDVEKDILKQSFDSPPVLEISSLNEDKYIEKKIKKEHSVKIHTEKREHVDLKFILDHLTEDGIHAKGQKVKAARAIRDTKWQIKERRIIGVHDDLQWIMTETFKFSVTEVFHKMEVELQQEKQEPLVDGWWYRRITPREHPVSIVVEMNTCRNILKDCTKTC